MGPTSALFPRDPSIVIGEFVGAFGLYFLILVIFPVLKYMGACLCIFLLGFIGVLKVAKVEATSCSMGPRDKLSCFGGIYISLGSEVFSGLDFSSLSNYSFSSCSFPTSTSGYSTALYSSSSISSSSNPTASSSFMLDPSSPSHVFPFLPPTLEAGVSPQVKICVSINVYQSMSMTLEQRTWILKFLKASTTIILMRPLWPMCHCFPFLTF